MREELLSRLQSLLTQRRQIFTGIANSSGVGKLISVSLDDGRTVQAKSLNIQQTGSAIAVVFDVKTNEYLAFTSEVKQSLSSRKYVYRKNRYAPTKKEVIDYAVLFKTETLELSATTCTCPTWTLVNGTCKQVCNGTGEFATLSDCQQINPTFIAQRPPGDPLFSMADYTTYFTTDEIYFEMWGVSGSTVEIIYSNPDRVFHKDGLRHNDSSQPNEKYIKVEWEYDWVGHVSAFGDVLYDFYESYTCVTAVLGGGVFSSDSLYTPQNNTLPASSFPNNTQKIHTINKVAYYRIEPWLILNPRFAGAAVSGDNVTQGRVKYKITQFDAVRHQPPSPVTNSFYLSGIHAPVDKLSIDDYYDTYITTNKRTADLAIKKGISPGTLDYCKLHYRQFKKDKVVKDLTFHNPDAITDIPDSWQKEWISTYAIEDPASTNDCYNTVKSINSNVYKNVVYYIDLDEVVDGVPLKQRVVTKDCTTKLYYRKISTKSGTCVLSPPKSKPITLKRLLPEDSLVDPTKVELLAISPIIYSR